MTDSEEIERRLKAARERLSRTPIPFGDRTDAKWREYESASADVPQLERSAAAAKGEEYAESIAFPVQWSIGAPLPALIRERSQGGARIPVARGGP